ncbi:hypothetical protein [Dactylosporangium sp. NPDC005555]|uniref:hypothetical protein n=1 Tax=Dactylosporangium sp. NPDC005555 TaxID=3154889 RepID=UPI0033B96D23
MTEPLALPPCEPGGPDPGAVTASIAAWITSAAMRDLVGHFGGEVPAGPVHATLDQVAEFSKVWDFRAGTKERFDTARVGYGADDARIRALIHTLGLGGTAPARDRYDHVVILGGGIRVTLGRAGYTARLLEGGLSAGTVAGLGSLRHRDDREHREGIRLGLGALETEADMMTAALRRFLNLPEPVQTRTGDGWWHQIWPQSLPQSLPRPAVHVLAAASTRPPLRASTACSLLGWVEHVHTPAPADRILLVTNDPYVRFQHCDAIRLLGQVYGCGIETIGMDELATTEWGRPLATTELLQEVRSSIIAMRNLYQAFQK